MIPKDGKRLSESKPLNRTYYLQHSRSSGNIHRYLKTRTHQIQCPIQNQLSQSLYYQPQSCLPLISTLQQKIKSTPTVSGNILHNYNRGHFNGEPSILKSRTSNTGSLTFSNGLKKSKSFTAYDNVTMRSTDLIDGIDLGNFPVTVYKFLIRALEDPNALNARELMDLVKHVLVYVIENQRFALQAAKICITIIEKETNITFLESMINTCQEWYQEYSQFLRDVSAHRFSAFMLFLNEMYFQLKRRQLQLTIKKEDFPSGKILLKLLWRCCQDCLQPPLLYSFAETNVLFFIMTCIGKDLAINLPMQLHQLINSIRDTFLNEDITSAFMRKTLLQLIELHAANWQLPAPAVVYYCPGSSM